MSSLGYTTLEILVALAVLAILVALAVPSLADLINRQRLKGAAQRANDDLREARSLALVHNKNIFVSFAAGDPEWCYGMDDEKPCNCKVSNDCTVNGTEIVTNQEHFPHIAMPKARFAGGVDYTSFDPARGTPKDNGARNGSIWFQSPNGEQLAVVLSLTSRIRQCSPTLSEFTQCAAPTLP